MLKKGLALAESLMIGGVNTGGSPVSYTQGNCTVRKVGHQLTTRPHIKGDPLHGPRAAARNSMHGQGAVMRLTVETGLLAKSGSDA